MIGLGLSLMGGALSQTENGAGDRCYFLSGFAETASQVAPSVEFLLLPVYNCWGDEALFADSFVDWGTSQNGSVLGAGATNVRVGSIYYGGSFAQRVLSSSLRVLIFGSDEIQFSNDRPLGRCCLRLNGGDYMFDIFGRSQSGSVPTGDHGPGSTRALVITSNTARFNGIFWQSARAGRRVCISPAREQNGAFAIIVHDNSNHSLIEL